MGKKFKAEQIVMTLREIELALSKGMDAPQACRQAGVSEQSYYRWRKEYGGMKIDQTKPRGTHFYLLVFNRWCLG